MSTTQLTLNQTTVKTDLKPSIKKHSIGYTVHLIGLHLTVAVLCVPVLIVLVWLVKHFVCYLFASGSEIFFDLVLPVTACVLAISVVILSNPMHALLSLIGVFLATVLFYISSGIEFIGLVFLIVYVGAVAILFLFVIMLLNVKSLTSLETLVTSPTQVIALAFGALLAYRSFTNIADSLGRTSTGAPAQRSHVGDIAYNVDDMVYHQVMFRESDVNAIAPLYTEHALLFVITTFNLLLALVGAIVLATSTTEQAVKMVPAPVKASPLAVIITNYTKISTAIVLTCAFF